jgi:prepilin-type processing-associated H-X9-DG protein
LETVQRGVQQGSVLGPLLFTSYINDCPRHINQFTNALFADGKSILIAEKNYENLNQKIMFTLDCSNRWFKANQLVLNLMQTNIIKFSPSHIPQPQLITEHNNTTINAVPDTKLLGVQTDNNLNWKCNTYTVHFGKIKYC